MNIDFTRILSRAEIATVVHELQRKKSRNGRQNNIVFRLSTFCGLRVGEITGLRMSDIRIMGKESYIRIPASISKSRRGKDRRRVGRVVPIWDSDTLIDLVRWHSDRRLCGATDDSPFVCCQSSACFGKRLSVRNCQARFKSIIKCLGTKRQQELSIHCGRHTFASLWIQCKSISPVAIRDALGHASLRTTDLYLHAQLGDSGQFSFIDPHRDELSVAGNYLANIEAA